ncbi:MAG: NAD(+)/NADH kinase, partial [Chloroflexota bacterium]|nr:NAD(+)/NADH kinase [Chloroflexota bacterium]
ILSIGGVGTILRAALAVVPATVPITGINLGKLGFMTELSADEAKTTLLDLLEGRGRLDERAMLEVELQEAGRSPRTFNALNDVVVARGAIARVIYVEATVDGQSLTTYKSDGVIVATATGSTGYSLSAGGPILHPQAREFVLLPILPHLSFAHAIVLPSSAVVKLHLSTTHEATLNVDGHINLSILSGATITVKHSPHTVRFLRIHPEAFYSSLEQRLKGKQ